MPSQAHLPSSAFINSDSHEPTCSRLDGLLSVLTPMSIYITEHKSPRAALFYDKYRQCVRHPVRTFHSPLAFIPVRLRLHKTILFCDPLLFGGTCIMAARASNKFLELEWHLQARMQELEVQRTMQALSRTLQLKWDS